MAASKKKLSGRDQSFELAKIFLEERPTRSALVRLLGSLASSAEAGVGAVCDVVNATWTLGETDSGVYFGVTLKRVTTSGTRDSTLSGALVTSSLV